MIYITAHYRLLRGLCCVVVLFGVERDKNFFVRLWGLCESVPWCGVMGCMIWWYFIIK